MTAASHLPHGWEYPEGAECADDGCSQPVAGVRPTREPVVFENQRGEAIVTYDAGEIDEAVCLQHAEGLQPNGETI